MATHSSILAWVIPWTEEPGGLWSMGLQRVRHDWARTYLPKSPEKRALRKPLLRSLQTPPRGLCTPSERKWAKATSSNSRLTALALSAQKTVDKCQGSTEAKMKLQNKPSTSYCLCKIWQLQNKWQIEAPLRRDGRAWVRGGGVLSHHSSMSGVKWQNIHNHAVWVWKLTIFVLHRFQILTISNITKFVNIKLVLKVVKTRIRTR